MAAKKKEGNSFTAALGGLGGGVDALFGGPGADEPYEIDVPLDDIEVLPQVRDDFESEDNTLLDLGNSLLKMQLQNIVLRVNDEPAGKPFILIAGERRLRAARLVSKPSLRARIVPLSSEEAEEAQFTENIHRKNLTQIEEARKVQRDLDALGSTEAVLAKYNKGAAWLSKLLGLLKLPEQASRLLKEGISADTEVIHQVRQIEEADPGKAREVVDELKAKRGKVNAREVVSKVKDDVKPSKAKQAAKKATGKDSGGTVATPKDRRHEEPSEGKVFAGAKPTVKAKQVKPVKQILADAYAQVYEGGIRPAAVLKVMDAEEADAADAFLRERYEAGKQVKNLGRVVIEGLRTGAFAADGDGALALVAVLAGAEGGTQYSMLNILGAVK